MKRYKIGFALGVFDMFNITHLNFLRIAKQQSETLIVGVISDDLLRSLNRPNPIINETDRLSIVESIRYVDSAVLLCDDDFLNAIQMNKADALFAESSSFFYDKQNILFKQVPLFGCSIEFIDNSNITDTSTSNIFNDYHIDKEDNKVLGYTTGVFDMFHIGHLNVIKRAKAHCDCLIVGVSTDENVISYKHKKPVIPYEERATIVRAVRYVDYVVPQKNMDKFAAWQLLHFNEMYHGDDWKGSKMFDEIEEKLKSVGCHTVYLPHTDGISSTLLKQKIDELKLID